MSRAVFKVGEQKIFFQKIRSASQLNNEKLGKMIGISGRSFLDWCNEKTLPKLESLKLLAEKFQVPEPKTIEIREEFWSGRIHGKSAALACIAKHGPPGTTEGRKKGGRNSQANRRQNPTYYKSLGCIVQNSFRKPKKMST